jgi:hypothetical protein
MFHLFRIEEKYFGGLKSLIQRCVVGVVTRLRSGRFGFESGEWLEIFPFSKPFKTHSGARPVSFYIGTTILFWEKNGRVLKLNTDIRLVPLLRMSGYVPIFPLHATMTCTETTLSSRLKSLCTIIFEICSCDVVNLLLERCFS